jgi:hypothetical protein
MDTIALDSTNVNSPALAPVFNSTGCLRSVPCETRTFKYVSERCVPCFNKFIAQFDKYIVPAVTLEPEPTETGPTAIDSFVPTADDDAAYRAWLAELADRDDIMAGWAEADRADDMEAAFSDPWDLVNPAELVECGGYHPSLGYDN